MAHGKKQTCKRRALGGGGGGGGAGAEVAVNENATLSLGYGGLLSQNHQDNSVNAGFTWRF
ncbi:autotransporter outer membrane beta-barrel domain-containing protein [Serratia bockelmannii]|uniref:autotransporter outer membrane beta-barrel domain-containing protein n=1 Tax=Serratia bockelmannii TaxID=2703793 RepID=UPI003CF95FFE